MSEDVLSWDVLSWDVLSVHRECRGGGGGGIKIKRIFCNTGVTKEYTPL